MCGRTDAATFSGELDLADMLHAGHLRSAAIKCGLTCSTHLRERVASEPSRNRRDVGVADLDVAHLAHAQGVTGLQVWACVGVDAFQCGHIWGVGTCGYGQV
eukprot:130992-Chlamydomonas_euryale.AAC.7